MELKKNLLCNVDAWFRHRPPQEGEKQWCDGRSAKELARYMTSALPAMPHGIEEALRSFTADDALFDWDAEYITPLPGKGNGRNHDAVLFNSQIFVGIEAKADESFGSKYVTEELSGASPNKSYRIHSLAGMIFGRAPQTLDKIRYQLLTASAGVLLEAKAHHVPDALLLILIFRKPGVCSPEKLDANHADFDCFIRELNGKDTGNGWYALTTPYGGEHHINLYLRKLEIDI